MKTLIPILLLALLVGCASPYYPVYVNDEGDYYIAERATVQPYYGAGYYPWWLSGYPPQTCAYYSPYCYPYYFSVWYPPGYWYPPYLYHPHHRYPGENRIVVNPVLPPMTVSGPVVAYPGLPVNRDLVSSGGKGYRVVAPPRSASAYDMPTARMSSSRPAGFSLPSTHSGSLGRGKGSSSRLSTRHHQ